MDNIPQERQRNILLLQTDKELGENLVRRLKESCHVSWAHGAGEAESLLGKEAFDALLVDIDDGTDAEDVFKICRQLKEDERFRRLAIVAVLSPGKTGRVIRAVSSGMDYFLTKPLEPDDLLKRLQEVSASCALAARGKKCINLEQIHFLTNLMGQMDRKDFFQLAPVVFDFEIIGRLKDAIGEMVFAQIFARLRETIAEEYAFMKEAYYGKGHFLMQAVEQASLDVPVSTLAAGFRQYVHAFFKMVHVLTSDILFGRPVEILLVEDNPGDVRLVEEALKEGRLPLRLTVVSDGEEAMSYLRREGRYRDVVMPDLVLLDLNLPKKDGREVLKEMKADSAWSLIPVIIMTISKDDCSYFKAQGLEVDFYITKPFDLNQFVGAVWFIKDSRFDAIKILS